MSKQESNFSELSDEDRNLVKNINAIFKKLSRGDAKEKTGEVNKAATKLDQALAKIRQDNESPDKKKGTLETFRAKNAARDAFTMEVAGVEMDLERMGFREMSRKLYSDSEIEKLVKPVNEVENLNKSFKERK